jgi:hypothetical protein
MKVPESNLKLADQIVQYCILNLGPFNRCQLKRNVFLMWFTNGPKWNPTQESIAKSLNKHKSNVCRAFNDLLKNDVLIEGISIRHDKGTTPTYELHPEFIKKVENLNKKEETVLSTKEKVQRALERMNAIEKRINKANEFNEYQLVEKDLNEKAN